MQVANASSQAWKNYEFLPSFVLGFHGCDATISEAVLRGEINHLAASENDYDWLGGGIYFWEGNPSRALQFAAERALGGHNSKGAVQIPFVLGAIINMRRCLNLADSGAIRQVENAYRTLERMSEMSEISGDMLPENGKDFKARRLDCLVINSLHRLRAKENSMPYDTVRGLFWEGEELYPGAGLREANHIQICVRSADCILGYFRPTVPTS